MHFVHTAAELASQIPAGQMNTGKRGISVVMPGERSERV